MEPDLSKFLVQLAAPMEKIFLEDQRVNPMWVIEGANGLTVLETPWMDDKEKTEMVQFVKKRMKEVNATRLVHIGEVWMLRTPTLPKSIRLGGKIASHPDRIEALIARVEDKDGNCIERIRYILRPEKGEATLAPAETITHKAADTEGTMANMFKD